MRPNFRLAVVGATGAVGREILKTLEQRAFPVSEVKLFASERSAGEKLDFHGEEHVVEQLSVRSFQGIDIALFSAGSAVSQEYAPIACENGAVVVDNSSYFRMRDDVPLIVPEVNGDLLRTLLATKSKDEGFIIANPNCSTIQLTVVLAPIRDRVGLRRVVVSTYQSVSGAGQKGMTELWDQTNALSAGKDAEPNVFPHQIAFNCIPQIDIFLEDGYTKEERKMINESRKILSLPDLKITTTCVRVPVFACHAESVNIETERALDLTAVREILRQAPGVIVADDPEKNEYPLGCAVVDTDATYVGRIRSDDSVTNGLNLWIVADNLRKGAALNAVQISEIVINEWARTRTIQ